MGFSKPPKLPPKQPLLVRSQKISKNYVDFGAAGMSNKLMALVEQASMKSDITVFEVGDTVDVHTKILEGNKERIQIFSGVVIARSGSGTREMFVVRRIVGGEGVERKFPLHSPKIEKIEVKRRSVVRRAKLYFLRERSGKAVRLTERRV
jgi:large subunit ribosomal protein L19